LTPADLGKRWFNSLLEDQEEEAFRKLAVSEDEWAIAAKALSAHSGEPLYAKVRYDDLRLAILDDWRESKRTVSGASSPQFLRVLEPTERKPITSLNAAGDVLGLEDLKVEYLDNGTVRSIEVADYVGITAREWRVWLP
jgi:hypothetical protein